MIGSVRLDFFDRGDGLRYAKAGIVPLSQLLKYDVYKTYLHFLKEEQDVAKAMTLTAEEKNISYSTVWRARDWFEE